ncbi:MAG: TonB-dependent receptor plug domain-containing protein, partial [Thermoanaerobaculia bacterium]
MKSVLLLLLLFPLPALALEGLLLLPNGEPATGSQLSIVGRSGSVRVVASGRFVLDPPPPFPATFIATGPRGEVYPPLHVERAPEGVLELRLVTAYQESVTVVTGAAPNIDAPPGAATVIAGQEDLDARQPQHLTEAIQGIAGVGKTEESAAAVPVIRGLSGGRTLILVDGARVSTERRAGASASFIDPFGIASVEVSRGPGSVAYGS